MTTSDHLVLVVDDEPHMCNVLRRILKKEGYNVITAPDGVAALRLTKQKTPDLILLDLMMPGIDGMEVCRRVREFSGTTRIIYFTAKVELTDTFKFEQLQSGADACIVKPAASKQILSTIGSVLSAVTGP